jgi:PEP-CTERM motif
LKMMMQRWYQRGRTAALLVFILGWAAPSRAGQVTLTIAANTMSVASQTGTLDFQFNPLGPGSSDTATMSAFSSFGIVGSPTSNTQGDVTGNLNSLPVTIADDQPVNLLEQTFTYSMSLNFVVTLDTNSSSPGAAFTFTMFDAMGNPVDSIGSGDPAAVEVDVAAGGYLEPAQSGTGIMVTPQGMAAPEPSSLVLLALGLLALAGYTRFPRRYQVSPRKTLEK